MVKMVDDTLIGGTGSDVIDGGFDHDVAVFAGHQSAITRLRLRKMVNGYGNGPLVRVILIRLRM